MLMVMPKIVISSIIILIVLYLLSWRIFSKTGRTVNKEVTKIKTEANKKENVEGDNKDE